MSGESRSRGTDGARSGDDKKLRAALRKAEGNPGDEAAWNEVEAVAAAEHSRWEEVAASYLKLLKAKPSRAITAQLARRALRVHEEWLAADVDALVEILELALESDPGLEWAFERLTLILSSGQRWDALLALYDRAIAAGPDGAKRRALLTEAAAVAKDFVGQIDRAIGYLDQLFRARPGDAQVAASLERLLERQGSWDDLARVWQTRLGASAGAEARELRERLATLYLDRLGDGERALVEAKRLLEGGGDDAVACGLLERILGDGKSPAPLRGRALALLRAQHEKMGRDARLVSALRSALDFVPADEKPALLREIAERLARQGDTSAAMDEMVALLRHTPDDGALRARLAHLAGLAGTHDVLVRGLLAAADATSDGRLRVALLLEAAQIEDELLSRPAEATTLYRRVVDDEAAELGRKLAALRRLVDLLSTSAQAPERLAALERMADLERGAGAKRTVLGESARLALSLGETARAAAAWRNRLAIDPTDREALDALVDLAAASGDPAQLVEALRARASTPVTEAQRRADFVRIADVQEDRLGDLAGAIDTWVDIETRFGEDATSVATLRALLAKAERWRELVDRLSRSGETDRARLAEQFQFLGDVCRKHLDDPAAACGWYARALRADPGAAAARAALRSLADEVERCRPAAVAALVRASTELDDWRGLLELTEHRISLADDAAAQARLCAEAAELAEWRGDDPAAALSYVARSLALAPEDGRGLGELLRLAEKTGGWSQAAEVLEATLGKLSRAAGRERAANLWTTLAQIREDRLGDRERALTAYEVVLRAAPERSTARAAVVRLAAGLGRWVTASEAALAAPVIPDFVDRELMPLLETALAAANQDAPRALADAMTTVIAQRAVSLPAGLARELETRVAGWLARSAGAAEDVRSSVEQALLRAVAQDPEHVPTLERLAQLQREVPGRALYDTLMRLAALKPDSLEPLLEAATLAEKGLENQDASLHRAVLMKLLDRATALLRAGAVGTAQAAATAALVRATEGLAALMVSSKDRAEARRALDLLMDAARLPVGAEHARAFLRRAGRIAVDHSLDAGLARDIYRRLLDEQPDDPELAATLARLYEEAGHYPDLLALRRRALATAPAGRERVGLRLELARVGGLIEAQTARVPTLLQNLDESPGHPETIAALTELLESHGRHRELCDVLTAQARKLDEADDQHEAAARLWAQAAKIAERPLGDVARALAAHERVAALTPTPATLDALARLYRSIGEPGTAASWLEQRLGATATGEERMAISQRLSDLYLAAGQRHRAISCLERMLQDQPQADAARATLIELYRAAEAREPLAQALAARCEHSTDHEVVLASSREAAALFTQLGKPERAAAVLERALAIFPSDRGLRTTLAEVLSAAGRPGEARAALQPLLDEMGRRRSRERAHLHHQIAIAARAEGNLSLAQEHLEAATSMVLDQMPMQLALAEVLEENRDLPRAEQAYRSLLVLARRADATDVPLASGEILLRLERIARERGLPQAAADCFDSALACAMQSPAEARRLQAALLARGDSDAAISLLEKRRAAATAAADEARIACELGSVLATCGRDAEAFELLLRALDKVPENVEAHAEARALGVKLQQSKRYFDMLVAATDQRRRWDDGPRVAELLLRAAEVAERDLGDERVAANLYARVEQTGARVAEALTGLARVSASLGDTAEEASALDRLQRLANDTKVPAERAELLYRLTERQLAGGTTRAAGLASLAAALDAAPDFPRALALVRAASIPDDELPQVMPLYEKVARASGDERMRLDFLERRAATPQATQAEVREGVELALALGEPKRAEALLDRAVALARRQPGGLEEGSWALVELAELRRAAGELDGAARLLEDAREVSGHPRVLRGLRDIAREAARQGKTALAARVLERLRDSYPADRDVWQPLLALYAQLGDRPSMERLVEETTSKLLDRTERSLVRMAWARFLLDSGDTSDRISGVLRDILVDEPGQPDAVMLLADLHEKRGDTGQAVELLSEALRADGNANDARRAALVRRLAELVSRANPAEAKKVYRAALTAPVSDGALKRSLQSGLLALLDGEDEAAERAALAEEILSGETGAAAAAAALELAELRERLGDLAGARRALEIGRERAPHSRTLFERLVSHHEHAGHWQELAALLADEAAHLSSTDHDAAAAQWRQAARIVREKLKDEAKAGTMLRNAVAASPGDPELLRELCGSLLATRQWDVAVEEVSRALTLPEVAPTARVGLLRLRAELRTANGEDSAAVSDLEQAFTLDSQGVAAELTAALSRFATRCANEGHVDDERRATFRLAELFSLRGEGEGAQELLFRWIENHPEDHEALHVLRQRFEADGRWDEVAQVCVRLLEVESGDAKVSAALSLAEACEHLGQPADAIPSLEQVLEEFPGHRALLARLVQLMRAAGHSRRAGALMVDVADNETDDEARFAALSQAAEILLEEGDPGAAFAALEKAVAINPKDRNVRRMLADASLAAGLYQEAAEVLGTLLSETRGMASSEAALLYHRLGRAVGGLGDTSAQMQALKRALDADRRNGVVASELADLAEHLGDDDLALRALRAVTLQAIDGPLSPAMAFYRQARIAHRQGDRPRALIFTKRALQEDPQLGVAHEFLQQLG